MAKSETKTAKPNGGSGHPENMVRRAVDAFLAEQQKTLAVQIDDLTRAMKAASASFDETGHANAATLASQAAEEVSRWRADMLKLDAEDMLAKMQESSERHPWLYLSGAALAGMVLACYMNRADTDRLDA